MTKRLLLIGFEYADVWAIWVGLEDVVGCKLK